ncbi:MAG: asparagine synthase (glutamine-hydrolyzing), partial [Acidobacteria bacterium]|nr:asparagine synthase (glutamine-hydrolyzing) [Acidobacteriota bacterium]
RGPDQSGVYESAAVSLGAVRLKIIDLHGGDQPLRCGGHVLVFNGEIYNFRELRRELESEGVSFRSQCDSEVVLEAFRRWDLDCLPRLRGMFAFAVWNERERRLVLARDRLGIKPLYLHRRGDDIHFGSELKAIWAHPRIESRIDLDGLNRFLSLNYIPGPYTMAAGIAKLPPGHWLEWRNGRARTGAYWQLRAAPREVPLETAKEELDSLLKESVREHLISDVPLGVWASGGLDSSTILHYASQAGAPRLKTFSVGFPGRSFDESAYFREAARHYGSDHHEYEMRAERDLPAIIEQMAYYSDEPSADAGAVPVWFLSRMCREQVTVALSGEGADELFGGYYTYLADRYARDLRLLPATLRRTGLGLLRFWPASDQKISLEYKAKRLLEGSLLGADDAHFFWNGTFSPPQRRELLGRAFRDTILPMPAVGGLSRYLMADQQYYLADDILYKCDRMSMAHSLEVRPPFLDHRIVEFAARLPERYKLRGSTLKFVLRELMRGSLPRSILTRRKEGFDIPAHEWFRGLLRPLLLDTVTERAVTGTGLLQWPVVDRILRDHQARRANYGYHLWGLLTLFLWMKRWAVQPPVQETAREAAELAAPL